MTNVLIFLANILGIIVVLTSIVFCIIYLIIKRKKALLYIDIFLKIITSKEFWKYFINFKWLFKD